MHSDAFHMHSRWTQMHSTCTQDGLRCIPDALEMDSHALEMDSDALEMDSHALEMDSDALEMDSDALTCESGKASRRRSSTAIWRSAKRTDAAKTTELPGRLYSLHTCEPVREPLVGGECQVGPSDGTRMVLRWHSDGTQMALGWYTDAWGECHLGQGSTLGRGLAIYLWESSS